MGISKYYQVALIVSFVTNHYKLLFTIHIKFDNVLKDTVVIIQTEENKKAEFDAVSGWVCICAIVIVEVWHLLQMVIFRSILCNLKRFQNVCSSKGLPPHTHTPEVGWRGVWYAVLFLCSSQLYRFQAGCTYRKRCSTWHVHLKRMVFTGKCLSK